MESIGRKKVYVIGHRNPDTDSVVAATAYAWFKRQVGMENCLAARTGNVNPQTEYIYERFGVALPELVPDLIPKVGFYLNGDSAVIRSEAPLRDGMEQIEKTNLKALPIVDEKGRYLSMLHYQTFARSILERINPHKKGIIPTSIHHLLVSMHAQPVLTFDPERIFKGMIAIAASTLESFNDILRAEPPENMIVIVGDREDVQRAVLQRGVRAVVITNGKALGAGLKELAERKRVSVMISPFDTSSTALLTIYSSPVRFMGDASLQPVHVRDPIRRIRAQLSASAARCLPVVDDDGVVVGVISKGDLINEPNIEVILVDHNELGQAVEGVEHCRILEVVDHHRLGTFSTQNPITFINRCVGSTSTIIAGLYREQHIAIPREIASLLLCGILADTIMLQSTTTSEPDREMAEYLSSITDLEIATLGREILTASSAVERMSAEEIVRLDQKEYAERGLTFSVSQIEVTSPDAPLRRREELLAELSACRERKGYCFCALLVTDITQLSSHLFICGPREYVAQIRYPEVEGDVFLLKDVLSRKKQLLPLLLELLERMG